MHHAPAHAPCTTPPCTTRHAQDYEAAAAYIGTFFDLESKLTHHSGQVAVDDGEDAQRQVWKP
jgi:hypothetical protein